MQRRKFLVGMGSMAAGGAATIGSGAFESGQAEGRRVDAEIEDDPDAYIGIEPADNPQGDAFARVGDDNGRAIVDFNGIETNDEDDALSSAVGEGPNGNAEFVLPDVLTITNQTPEEVEVSLSAAVESVSAVGANASSFTANVVPQGNDVSSGIPEPGVALSLDNNPSDASLGVGETINVGFGLDTKGFTSDQDGTSSGEDTGEDSFAVNMTVHADSV
jgi:hypothetical protein